MAITLQTVNDYLENHFYNDEWKTITDDTKKESLINTAQIEIKGLLQAQSLNLREDYESTDNWFHAVCEQVLQMLNREQDLFQLQQQNVTFHGIDGMQYNMKGGFLSPVVMGYLKPLIKLRKWKVI